MNKVYIKSPEELALMRQSGQLLAQVFAMLDGKISEGVSTLAIEQWVEAFIVDELKARPASKGQYGCPFCIITSLNEALLYCILFAYRLLQCGDIHTGDVK